MRYRRIGGVLLGLGLQFISAQAQEEVVLDLMSGKVTAPFLFSNSCLLQTIDTDLSGGGRAVYTFTITNGGSYAVMALVHAPRADGNAFYVNIDAEPEGSMIWEIPQHDGFTNRFAFWAVKGSGPAAWLQPKFFSLGEGEHQLVLRGKSAHVRIQRLLLVRRPAPPTNLRVTDVSRNTAKPPLPPRGRAG